jgi:hypothetical protein
MQSRAWIATVTAATLLAACNQQEDTAPTSASVPSLAVAITPYLTSQPSQLKPLGPTTDITPIITVGDPLPGAGAGAGAGDHAVWGPSDGLGAYANGNDLVLFANHESSSSGVDGLFRYARVSRLVLDIPTLAVKHASYPVTGSWLLERLCSATWVTAKEGLAPGYFLTGEESTSGAFGGTTVAVSSGGQVTELPWLGKYAHENTIAVPDSRAGSRSSDSTIPAAPRSCTCTWPGTAPTYWPGAVTSMSSPRRRAASLTQVI